MNPVRLLALFAAFAVALPMPVAAASEAKDGYGGDSRWLCLPDRADPCSTPIATTDLLPGGYGARTRMVPAKDPPIDCFYVYPTVSSDEGTNSDFIVGREEKLTAETQMARFASVCRPFAPVYRQMTLGTIAAYFTGASVNGAAQVAYRDVASAFRNYIATRNGGRPFVLIGHSQGSLMLIQLIAREIEGNPVLAKRMQLAILPGYNLLVPQGKLTGGSLRSTPLCSRPGETHCVVAWTSFRDKNAPPPGAMFGYADRPGMTVGCVNPVKWGSTGWTVADGQWFARSSLPVPGGPISWSSEGAPPTPYVHTPGLASVRCINQGARGYLSVRVNADPRDKRTDRIGGEVGLLGMFLPGWGMHLADMAIVQGDLVREVGEISARSRTVPQR